MSGSRLINFMGKVAQVCWGLIKGIAYLHKFCIAHRDIKPENLLVDWEFCLKFIDFDVAMQVRTRTSGRWRPRSRRSRCSAPTKADRWSSGQALLYLPGRVWQERRQEDTVLKTTARKLTGRRPEQRPSMLQVAASPSDVANVAVERKAWRPLQDTVEVDGENAKSPRVKQKLSVPGKGGWRSQNFMNHRYLDLRPARSMIFSCSWCSLQ